MGKSKKNAEETVEVKAGEATQAKVEETTEVKAEEKVEETAEVKTEEKVKKLVKIKKELKTKHYQHPDDLCEFVNLNDVTVLAIVAFDRFQALYYYENK